MRWVTFMVCAAGMLTLQSTIAPRVELIGCRPDWLLVLVVYLAMFVRPVDAVAGAWILGACADLMTIERPGLLALSYMMAALCVAASREYFFRYRTATQVVVTAITCLFVHAGWWIYHNVLYGATSSLLGSLTVEVIGTSLYTAVWGLVWFKILTRISGALGVGRPRYTYSGLHRLEEARV
ncbi:MAG: rod shape-determining protein MreD [Phycisphaerales bacterium]|nr:MAG: rod shape-determining protein MreD [Phycisphaerales bacterium]